MLRSQYDISVIIATRNRALLLRQALESLEKQHVGNLSWEAIVIDNGSTDTTSSVLSHPWKFTLIRLWEPIAGKSRALNQALEQVRGSLLAFTDDDVLLFPHWLSSLYAVATKYPSAQLFCGPVTPTYPPETPRWLQSHPYLHRMFGAFEPALPEGPLPEPWTPFGVNFSVRARAVVDQRFSLDLGPSLENGPMFHEDTEFTGRFRKTPGNIIFCPRARVIHQITGPRLTLEYLCERSFQYGRSHVIASGQPAFIHKELAANRIRRESGDVVRYEQATLINYYCGQQYQFELMGSRRFAEDYRRALQELELDSNRHLLADSAKKAVFFRGA